MLRLIERPYRVVIIDDEEDVSEVMATIVDDHFGQDTFQIKRCSTVPEAFAYLKNNRAEIIITDIMMNGQFGDTILRECKTFLSRSIFIVISGDESFVTISNCYLDGARYYLKKPFDRDKFIEVLVNCLSELDHWERLMKEFAPSNKKKIDK